MKLSPFLALIFALSAHSSTVEQSCPRVILHALHGVGPDFPRAEFPELYQYEADNFVFRALEAPITSLDNPQSLLDLDNPTYNDISASKRVQTVKEILEGDGPVGILREQGYQSRPSSPKGRLKTRISMAATEDLSQILEIERYGSSNMDPYYSGQAPHLRLLAQVQPDPSSDPAIFARLIKPKWNFHETALLQTPSPQNTRWYFVAEEERNHRTFEIMDPEAFRRAANRWPSLVPKGNKGADEILLREALKLVKEGILREDPVLPALSKSNGLIFLVENHYDLFLGTNWGDDLTDVKRALAEVVRLLGKAVSIHEKTLHKYMDDSRVIHNYRRARQRVLKHWQQLEPHCKDEGSKKLYARMLELLDQIDSFQARP